MHKNTVNASKVVGTCWTATKPTHGYDYFVVVTKRKADKKNVVELMAANHKPTRFWVDIDELKERGKWLPGWKVGVCVARKEGKTAADAAAMDTQPCPCCTDGWVQCRACRGN